MAVRSCLLAVTLASLSFPAWAQSCVSRDDLVKHLESKYHEAPAAVGIADNGALLEVFASKDGETWTVAVTLPNGISCMVATGQQWQELPRALKGEAL